MHINQLELHILKLTASADRLSQLSSSAELALQTQLAEIESSLVGKQQEMGDVTSQLHDHREVMVGLQQVCFSYFQPCSGCAVLYLAGLQQVCLLALLTQMLVCCAVLAELQQACLSPLPAIF